MHRPKGFFPPISKFSFLFFGVICIFLLEEKEKQYTELTSKMTRNYYSLEQLEIQFKGNSLCV